jgi:hypothetical protein
MTANTELTIVEKIATNSLVASDGSEHKVPMSYVFGRGISAKTESFGGRSLVENAEITDKAIADMQPLQKVWNHSHSQWDWKHITFSFFSDFRNMKQIEAEMSRKRSALNDAKWRQVKNEIKIRKIEEQLAAGNLDYWQEIDLKVKLAELKEGIAEGTEYIEGAMKDVMALHSLYEQLKAKVANFTEEDFEREESKSHLKRSLVQCIRDVRQFGTITKGEQEYMEQIGVNPAKIQILIRNYIEEERTSDDWSTDGLFKFVEMVVNDLIDNKKVDTKRMIAMGFDPEPSKGISYDKQVALLTKEE